MGKALAGYRRLFDGLKQGAVRSLYFLYGPEEFLKREFVRGVIELALPTGNRAFNLDILYGDDFDVATFDDRISSFPLFTDRRVVILKNFNDLSITSKDHVIAGAERVSASVVLVVETPEEKLDNARLKAMGKVADARGLSAAFPLLDDEETIERVMGRLKREGFSIEPEALELLVESVGTRLVDLGNEVDKLLLAVGDGTTIDRSTVAGVVGRYRTEGLFSLLDVVGRNDPALLVRRVSTLIDGGEEPVFLLAMLQKRVVLLLQVCAIIGEKGPRADNGRSLAAHMGGATSPFYAEVLRRQADRLDPSDLERLLANLRWADVKLKTTQLEPKCVLGEALLASHLGKTLASPAV
jgi:DNA polymerase-3 subunit delta